MHSFGKSLLFILQGQVQGHLLTRSCAIYRCHVVPLLVGYSVPALDSGLTASIWLALANRIRWKWWWARVKPGPQETHSMLSSAITMRTSPAQLVEGGETHGAEPSHCRDQSRTSLVYTNQQSVIPQAWRWAQQSCLPKSQLILDAWEALCRLLRFCDYLLHSMIVATANWYICSRQPSLTS